MTEDTQEVAASDVAGVDEAITTAPEPAPQADEPAGDEDEEADED